MCAGLESCATEPAGLKSRATTFDLRQNAFLTRMMSMSGRRALMQRESVLMCGLVMMMATAASAQTKFSGSQTCTKPDPTYTIPVGDSGDHVISLTKDKCKWTRGQIAGVQLKEDTDTIVSEDINATTALDRGWGVTLLANGDTAFIKFEGTTTIRSDVALTGRGTWTFTGGTGKLTGIKGKGTYTGKYSRDGTSTFEVEGEYQISTPARGK